MIKFFEWIATLNSYQAWGLFALICAAMAFVPYAKVTFKWLRLLFSNQEPEIIDFSWRVSKDHFLFKAKDKSYYLNSSKQNFILEGGKLILNWYVKGAFRIDVQPIGKKLKGNTAVIAAKRSQNHFKLIAYTTKGKLEKELLIAPELFRDLSTLNLSQEEQFKQNKQARKTISFTSANTLQGRYRSDKIGRLPNLRTSVLSADTRRLQYPKQISQMKAWYDRKIWKAAQSRYFRANNFHGVAFHPLKYKQAMELNEQEKLIS